MTAIPKILESEIQNSYNELLKEFNQTFNHKDKELIYKAFRFAYTAHQDMIRKSGEPFIYHPIGVAKIASNEIGMGAKAISSALLHDVVEDTDYTVENIEKEFGKTIAVIVDGLTKITSAIQSNDSAQAATFKKIILTMSDDVRVVLIKLADRLHNMRTLDALPRNKQIKMAGETIYLYAPIANRLGLFLIKQELEDLSLKYRYPKVYEELQNKIESREKTRKYYINNFISPIEEKLKNEKINFKIERDPPTIYSIWYRIQHHGIPFEEIYDLMILDIIVEPSKGITEKAQCWNVYSYITDIYMPKPEKIHDYVTKPRANGYEALHATFMGPDGKWVEVRIRTTRMEAIAKRGLAASLERKTNKNQENELEKWINRVRELIETPSGNATEFLDDFKLNLFSSEILVFTPKGHIITLPKSSTALDFAYEIHTEIGNKAIAAKVNHKLVPLNHKLNGGDQVEILTSDKKNSNNSEWLEDVITAKARTKIKKAISNEVKNNTNKGRLLLNKELSKLEINPDNNTYRKLNFAYGTKSKDELYGKIGSGIIPLNNLKKILKKKNKNKWIRYWELQISRNRLRNRLNHGKILKKSDTPAFSKKEPFVLLESDSETNQAYKTAKCCKPIPGDEVIGHFDQHDKIIIHKSNCPTAVKLMSQFANKVVPVKWKTHQFLSFLVRIKIKGLDQFGIYNDITTVITKDLNVNIRTMNLDSYDGIFEGTLDLYVHDTKDLNNLISNLIRLKGVESVSRIEFKEE
jgi:GTP pyrophosphokinase